MAKSRSILGVLSSRRRLRRREPVVVFVLIDRFCGFWGVIDSMETSWTIVRVRAVGGGIKNRRDDGSISREGCGLDSCDSRGQ
jgi:hypothetical protein